jgi:hypothetical protein
VFEVFFTKWFCGGLIETDPNVWTYARLGDEKIQGIFCSKRNLVVSHRLGMKIQDGGLEKEDLKL